MTYCFDARVIQDHFPGIGRYAYNLLAELPAQLRDDETLTVLHDPTVKNTRYQQLAVGKGQPANVKWIEYRVPVFGLENVLHTPSINSPILRPRLGHQLGIAGSHQSSIIHYPYYVRPLVPRPPSVTTIYDAISFVYPQYVPSARARLTIRLLHELAIRASRKVITISRAAANDLVRFFPAVRDKLVVTPLAPDPVFKPQSPQAIARVRAKFDLPNRFTLYLASNKPHKNLVRLINAWRLVIGNWLLDRDVLTNYQLPTLVIAGHQDPRYPQARQRVRELELEQYVHFIREVNDEDAARLYSACELFVYPSLYEGFGLTPLEAMACGASVVCSNVSSMPEVVGDPSSFDFRSGSSGQAALLFDPAKSEEIARACLRVLHDDALREQMRAKSLAQAARFTWRETARLTIAVYREVKSEK